MTDPFVLSLLTALVWGITSILEKAGLGAADAAAGLWVRCLGVTGGVALLPLLIPGFSQKVSAMGWRSALLLGVGGFLGSVGGQVFFYRALKAGDVGRVSAVAGAWPLLAFFLSVLLFQETVTAKKLAGICLVVSGVALLR